MSATIDAYEAVMKEVWTQDRLEDQMYTGTLSLEEIEKTDRFSHGEAVYVPLHSRRGSGYSAMPASGGQLNAAGEQGVKAARHKWTNHNYQIEIEAGAMDQSDGKPKAVAAVLETEVSGALDDVRKQIQRQLVGDGRALLLRCGVTSNSTTVVLNTSNSDAQDALERGWIHEGSKITIGSTSNESSVATTREVLSIDETPGAPKIVISGANVTTAATDYVSLAKSRVGAVSHELEGFEKLCSQTSTLGEIDPTTAGGGFWKAAGVDSTTTAITLEAMMWGGRKVHQRTGSTPDLTLMSLDQRDDFYSQLQLQVNFAGDKAIGAGNREGIMWAGQRIFADPDVLNRTVFFLSKKHLFLAGLDKPYWQNKYTGGKVLEYKQGHTSFVATLFHRLNLVTNRRNAHAALTGLARPTIS